MKSLLVVCLSLSALNVLAFDDRNERDPIEIYNSWCDSNNVMQISVNNQTVVRENCAASQKTCILNQKTQGHYVIYSASCQDTSRYDDKGDRNDKSDK